NHPGPAEFIGLAPFLRLVGGASAGVLIGSIVFQVGALAGSVAVVRRWTSAGAAAITSGGAAAYLGMPPEALRSPWNPYVGLGGVVALVALGWAFAERRRSGALLFAAVASVVAQVHLVAAPIALVTIAAALVLFAL